MAQTLMDEEIKEYRSGQVKELAEFGQKDYIVKVLNIFLEPGQVTELRALGVSSPSYKRPHTESGYFNDPVKLAEAATKIPYAKGIYIIPNPVNPALLARAENKIKVVGERESRTSDNDIEKRRWLYIDLDPKRPAGISSSDEEHKKALQKAKVIKKFLSAYEWPDPNLGDSSNGAHLLYRIDLPADDEGLIKKCLQSLAFRFEDDHIEIDQTVYNPARIWKLYGTWGRKGDDTKKRPHRKAKLLEIPSSLETVPIELLKKLAAQSPEAPKPNNKIYQPDLFDIDRWIEKHCQDIKGPIDWQNGRKWIFPICPWNQDHRDNSAYIVQFPTGAIGAGCHHNGCIDNDWHALRDKKEPGWREKKKNSDSYKGNGNNKQPATLKNKPKASIKIIENDLDLIIDPAPELNFDSLPDFPKKIIELYSDSYPGPDEFLLTSLLPTMGAAIGTRAYIKLQSFILYPSIWSMVMAPSSDKYKSTAIHKISSFLQKKDEEYEEIYLYEETSFKEKLEIYQNSTKKEKLGMKNPADEMPARKEIVFAGNETIESRYQTLFDNPDGGLLSYDELNFWLQSFDQYKKNAGGEKQQWLSIFDCCPVKYKRKSGKTHLTIKRPFVSIAGGMTMNTFLRRFKGDEEIENGFLPRFLFCYDPTLTKSDESFCRPEVNQNTWNQLYNIFEKVMELRPGPVIPDDKAMDLLDSWYVSHREEKEEPDFPEELSPFWKRLEGYLLKFCLIFHQFKRAQEQTGEYIGVKTIEEAITLISYYKGQAKLIIDELFENQYIKEVKKLIAFLKKNGNKTTKNEIRRGIRVYCQHPEKLNHILEKLKKQSILRTYKDGRKEIVELLLLEE